MNRVIFSHGYFPDPDSGRPISLGYIYVGEPDLDPVANPKAISVQQESGAVIPVGQPIMTNAGGVPEYDGSPVTILVDGDYSLRVSRSDLSQAYNIPNQVGDETLGRVFYVDDIYGLTLISNPIAEASANVFGYFFSAPESSPQGGGSFVWQEEVDKATANGGAIIDPDTTGGFDGSVSTRDSFLAAQGTGSGLGCWVRITENTINVKDFGAIGDNTGDDQSPVQAAYDYVESSYQAGDFVGLSDLSFPSVFFPKGVYRFGSTVGIPAYSRTVGDDSIITCDGSHYAFSNGNANAFWRFYINGMTIQDANGYDINNNNQDTGKILFDKCKFFGCPVAINYEAQSTVGGMKDCTWFKCDTELNIIKGDLVVVDGGWIKQGDRTANQQAGIENAGKLIIKNLIGVPGQTGGFSETAWINNRATAGGHRTGVIIIDKFRSGGETGSKTLVNNFAPANDETDIRPTTVIIKDSDVYSVDGAITTERGVVRLFDIPNLLAMRDNTGFNQTVAISAGNGVNLGALIAGKEDIIKIDLGNYKTKAFSFAEDPANNMLDDFFSVQSVSNQLIQTSFSESTDSSVSGWTYISKFATTAQLQLPPSKPGLEYTLIRSDTVGGGFFYKAVPATGETIRGGAVNDKLQISADWTGVTLRCVEEGFWEVAAVMNNSFGSGYSFAP